MTKKINFKMKRYCVIAIKILKELGPLTTEQIIDVMIDRKYQTPSPSSLAQQLNTHNIKNKMIKQKTLDANRNVVYYEMAQWYV
jgi:hypothetical protein